MYEASQLEAHADRAGRTVLSNNQRRAGVSIAVHARPKQAPGARVRPSGPRQHPGAVHAAAFEAVVIGHARNLHAPVRGRSIGAAGAGTARIHAILPARTGFGSVSAGGVSAGARVIARAKVGPPPGPRSWKSGQFAHSVSVVSPCLGCPQANTLTRTEPAHVLHSRSPVC